MAVLIELYKALGGTLFSFQLLLIHFFSCHLFLGFHCGISCLKTEGLPITYSKWGDFLSICIWWSTDFEGVMIFRGNYKLISSLLVTRWIIIVYLYLNIHTSSRILLRANVNYLAVSDTIHWDKPLNYLTLNQFGATAHIYWLGHHFTQNLWIYPIILNLEYDALRSGINFLGVFSLFWKGDEISQQFCTRCDQLFTPSTHAKWMLWMSTWSWARNQRAYRQAPIPGKLSSKYLSPWVNIFLNRSNKQHRTFCD